ATLVQGVENVTKVHVNPAAAEVISFRNKLVLYLSGSPNYGGLILSSERSRLSHTLDFIKGYPVKTIAELKADPQLGTFIVNARMVDIVNLDPWWYPVCKCNQIFGKYIGAFHCTKCNVAEFKPAPKVKLIVEVEDETGYALFRSFDHVMANLAVVDPS
ncbi:replication factor A protein, partial [Trifolium medium]|nr:replication factor A protein [Trifolium medium]